MPLYSTISDKHHSLVSSPLDLCIKSVFLLYYSQTFQDVFTKPNVDWGFEYNGHSESIPNKRVGFLEDNRTITDMCSTRASVWGTLSAPQFPAFLTNNVSVCKLTYKVCTLN